MSSVTPSRRSGSFTLSAGGFWSSRVSITFASLPGYIGYCADLPRDFRALFARYRTLQRFPVRNEPA